MALISENVNELIEEITKGYYGKKAISAAKSSAASFQLVIKPIVVIIRIYALW